MKHENIRNTHFRKSSFQAPVKIVDLYNVFLAVDHIEDRKKAEKPIISTCMKEDLDLG